MPGCSCSQNSRFYNPKDEVEGIFAYEIKNPKEESEIIYGFDTKLVDPTTSGIPDSNQTPVQPPCGGCMACDDCLRGYRNYRLKRAIKQSNENKLKKYAATKPLKKKRSKAITKRDINYEFKDLDSNSEYPSDLSIPEIIQYMPETLLPNFEKGQCIFGCKESAVQKRFAVDEMPVNGYQARMHEFAVDPSNYRIQPQPPQTESLLPNQDEAFLDPMQYEMRMAVPQQQFDRPFGAPQQSFAGPQHPFGIQQYREDPILGAPQYPERPHYRDPKMDHLVKQIVYSHPEFIDANNHGIPGPSLVPSEEQQEEELSDFFTKLVRGRIGQMFGEENHQQYGQYNPHHHHHQHQYDRSYREVDAEDEKNIFGI